MGGIGIWQLLIVLVIVLVIFGTKRFKNIGSDLGSAIKGFKKSMGNENKKNTTTKEIVDEKIIEGKTVSNTTSEKVKNSTVTEDKK